MFYGKDEKLMQNKREIVVTIAQFDVKMFNRDYNLKRMKKLMEEAKEKYNPDIIVFPECANCGYNFCNVDEVERVAEPIDGVTIEYMKKLSLEMEIALIFGIVEKDKENYYNTAVLIEKSGRVQSYRKTHLPYMGVDRYVKKGDKIGFFESEFGLIGIMICYDLRFPEVARELALRGANIVFLTTDLPKGGEVHPEVFSRARACENRIFVVTSNRIGQERGFHYIGRSQIINPMGEILLEMGENEGIAAQKIDLNLAEKKDIVVIPGEYETRLYKDRRPELYETLNVAIE